MLRVALGTALAVSVLSVAAPLAAQSGAHDMEARALFEAGRVAFIDERYEDALGHFQRAYDLSTRPELLYNIAACLDRLDREADSLWTFQQYLEALPDASNREEVELRIRVLEAHVARAAPPDTETPVITAEEEEEIEEIEAELGEETTIAVEGLSDETTTVEGTEGPVDGTPRETPTDGGRSIAEEPALWIILGIVVVGAAAGITAGVLLSQDPGYAPYSSGDVTVMTLRGTF